MAEFVDLSQEIYSQHPVYFAHPDTVVWTDTTFEDSEYIFRTQAGIDEPTFTYESRTFQISEHGPSHVDSIRHFKPDGEPIDEMPLENFHTPGKAIDVSHCDPNGYVTVDDVRTALSETGQTLEEGDTLLLHTGHYDRTYPERSYNEQHTGLTEAATRWIIEAGVANFGVDQPSPDNPSGTYPCHTLCTEYEVPHMENLCNIDRVVGDDFTFIGFPLPLRGGTGSPIRAVAKLEDE
ncbi:cyclase family protein [Natrarchaeobius oligotrophus]|uniref:Cyclase family protein n=1 Tax=Natrarchaeobius chitinivorans TaxID=1679083 RepID=A0A3N6MPB1_NATCH|nr:cyclase family protein [Natrarchaeobius chitinivorans]RQG99400.1 cyclase family protein [Natrarchaeobius chitinivorans]